MKFLRIGSVHAMRKECMHNPVPQRIDRQLWYGEQVPPLQVPLVLLVQLGEPGVQVTDLPKGEPCFIFDCFYLFRLEKKLQ